MPIKTTSGHPLCRKALWWWLLPTHSYSKYWYYHILLCVKEYAYILYNVLFYNKSCMYNIYVYIYRHTYITMWKSIINIYTYITCIYTILYIYYIRASFADRQLKYQESSKQKQLQRRRQWNLEESPLFQPAVTHISHAILGTATAYELLVLHI